MDAYYTKLEREILHVLEPYDRAENYLADHFELTKLLGNKNNTETASALLDLNDKGCVEYDHLANGLFRIFLTHKGIRFKEIRRAAFMRSAATWFSGFAAGVLSTVLAWWLSNL